ncbi:MAG: tRNA lysidine(34) synthetase TilS [Actinobacteria bacterium]|nr:tRNA lysidine(34) synthetase TilS [Actinomycetota bacterium]
MLERKAEDFIKKYGMPVTGDRVVVSVSGGPDSLALLLYLEELARSMKLDLHVFHLDHMIRGEESRRDAQFVRCFSESRGLPVRVVSENVAGQAPGSGLSKQHFAREVRLARLSEYADEIGASRIAVGHNADDQVETFLMRIIQGTGLKGLSGMAPVSGRIIRPFIGIWRSEIEEYLEEKGVEPVIDSSNLKELYLRNRIRHRLVPYLENEFGPGIKPVILREVDSLALDCDYVQGRVSEAFDQVAELVGDDVRMDISKLENLHDSVRRGVVREAWSRVCPTGSGLLWSHVNDILWKVAGGKSGAAVELPGAYVAEREYNELIIRSADIEEPATETGVKYLGVPGSVELEDGFSVIAEEVKAAEIVFSEDACVEFIKPGIKLPLELRKPRPGERFRPLGSAGMKKLKDYFIDIKLPRRERRNCKLLVCEGSVVWVIGFRLDERFRVPPDSEKAIRLEVRQVR